MPNAIPDGIRREHILAAIADLRSGVTHGFGDSARYDLVYQGHRYPPKAVVGLAAGKVIGSPLGPYDFKGGSETRCFRTLKDNGFSIEPKSKGYWWTSKPNERFWCEITDRPKEEVGKNLYCPQSNTANPPRSFWSYSLIQEIQPGDIVFHYYSPDHAIIGASVATANLIEEPITWTPHWTGKLGKEKKKAPALPRPGWKRSLEGYLPLDSPLTLTDIQKSDNFIRDKVAAISKNARPLVFLQMYPKRLRALQGGYVTKMPSELVEHWKILSNIADQLSGLNKVDLPDEATAEAVVADLLEQVAIKKERGGVGQGFVVDPERRKVIENYAVEKAKEYFDHEGFNEIIELGKPYDLLCSNNNGDVLCVEVKGTTSTGEKIFLTYNEVEHAVQNPTSTALFILHGINAVLADGKWKPSGGVEEVLWPWRIDRSRLKPLAFQYEVWPAR